MAGISELASRHVDRLAALDPVMATAMGVPGHDAEMTDYSPAGLEARHALNRDTLGALSRLQPSSDAERRAAEVMRERLEVEVDQHDAGERLRDLRIFASPFSDIRECFDLMATDSEEDWETIAARIERVPEALESFQAALREGIDRGLVAARRQALACVEQGLTWSGQKGAPSFFRTFVADGMGRSSGLQARLDRAAAAADAAYGDAAAFLGKEYAPKAEAKDAVGRERYGVAARQFLGMDLDLDETYQWGWAELHRIEDRMNQIGRQILPDGALPAVIQLLESEPGRSLEGEGRLRQWLQELMDRTIAELNGKHFDIPGPIKRVEAMIAPPGGAAAMYYTAPSEDFKRPGRTWYPTMGKTRFPLWTEVSTAYHEGVPGHHLQLAQWVYLSDTLNRFQRLVAFIPGNSEGWALYAERLMGELGYLENPDYELGMLAGQAMRATRVVLDIGAHLELPIPKSERYHPGERWTPELMLPFAVEHAYQPEDYMRSEVDRYLGWPGQAIAYKVGERVWLDLREQVKAARGAAFDLKAFHVEALNLGPMGLAQLRREFATALALGPAGVRVTGARAGDAGGPNKNRLA
ncbi:MAG TPA: DUF885 domain-containing protein [Candidatus Dormibacteraeota bacterium]|jgi:uncharacterized protein (DUF885 family)|nr:DUF885 domain-containing protein [Candidatus Dormibacteraeota bacterium]